MNDLNFNFSCLRGNSVMTEFFQICVFFDPFLKVIFPKTVSGTSKKDLGPGSRAFPKKPANLGYPWFLDILIVFRNTIVFVAFQDPGFLVEVSCGTSRTVGVDPGQKNNFTTDTDL